MLADADLVITAERKHADAVASISTEFGRRCFPARVAARLATWVVTEGSLNVAVRKAAGEVIEPDFASAGWWRRWTEAAASRRLPLPGIFHTGWRTSPIPMCWDSTCTK